MHRRREHRIKNRRDWREGNLKPTRTAVREKTRPKDTKAQKKIRKKTRKPTYLYSPLLRNRSGIGGIDGGGPGSDPSVSSISSSKSSGWLDI